MLFLKHLSQLESNEIGRIFYEKMKKERIPGLIEECREWLIHFNISFAEMERCNKQQWKNFLKHQFKEENERELLQMSKKYKKIKYDEISRENCEVKQYIKDLPYSQALLRFRIRADMVPTVKTHWKSDPGYEADLWTCWACPQPVTDTTSHIKRCPEYSDLRENLELDRTEHLVIYFQKVIDRRLSEQDDN